MNFTNTKLSFDIFTVGNLQNILISNDFWHKRKIANCDPYNVLLAITTNISQRLRTAFVLQGHTYLVAILCLLSSTFLS